MLLGNLRRYDAKLVPWDTAGTSRRFATRRDEEDLTRSVVPLRGTSFLAPRQFTLNVTYRSSSLSRERTGVSTEAVLWERTLCATA
ncbi:hypothetical protein HY57_14870 [Dyella japonica A8]|uniref:Uncharacterized protein n=1 Tax=Dyella japonica A8 TaxID=1217721 RepID=A0A075K274_9GAMM|nr:hypothetical protein HY57_14870 [Dyella japonica A8]